MRFVTSVDWESPWEVKLLVSLSPLPRPRTLFSLVSCLDHRRSSNERAVPQSSDCSSSCSFSRFGPAAKSSSYDSVAGDWRLTGVGPESVESHDLARSWLLSVDEELSGKILILYFVTRANLFDECVEIESYGDSVTIEGFCRDRRKFGQRWLARSSLQRLSSPFSAG